MGRHFRGLCFIHLIQLMGFNGTTVQQLSINHVVHTYIGNEGLESSEALSVQFNRQDRIMTLVGAEDIQPKPRQCSLHKTSR